MTIYQWLTLLGIPSIFAAVWAALYKRMRQESEETHAIKSGIQALLRAQMISDYNHYKEKGWAPIYAKDNFENCWKQYHGLGFNGVMDGVHKEFMTLQSTQLDDADD